MTGPALVLVVAVAVLFAAGFDMLMQRSLIRIVVGFMLLGHGANLLLLLAGGAAGSPPLLGKRSSRPMADPLPQAMALTAIVITFGVTAFLLALAFRSRMLLGEDEVRDDVEDHRICAERRHEAWAGGPDEEADPLEEDAEHRDTEQEGTERGDGGTGGAA